MTLVSVISAYLYELCLPFDNLLRNFLSSIFKQDLLDYYFDTSLVALTEVGGNDLRLVVIFSTMFTLVSCK